MRKRELTIFWKFWWVTTVRSLHWLENHLDRMCWTEKPFSGLSPSAASCYHIVMFSTVKNLSSTPERAQKLYRKDNFPHFQTKQSSRPFHKLTIKWNWATMTVATVNPHNNKKLGRKERSDCSPCATSLVLNQFYWVTNSFREEWWGDKTACQFYQDAVPYHFSDMYMVEICLAYQ